MASAGSHSVFSHQSPGPYLFISVAYVVRTAAGARSLRPNCRDNSPAAGPGALEGSSHGWNRDRAPEQKTDLPFTAVTLAQGTVWVCKLKHRRLVKCKLCVTSVTLVSYFLPLRLDFKQRRKGSRRFGRVGPCWVHPGCLWISAFPNRSRSQISAPPLRR